MTSDADAPAEPVTRAQRRRQSGRRGGWLFLRDVLVIILIAVVVSALVVIVGFLLPGAAPTALANAGVNVVIDAPVSK